MATAKVIDDELDLDNNSENLVDLSSEEELELDQIDLALEDELPESKPDAAEKSTFSGLPFLLLGVVVSFVGMIWVSIYNVQIAQRDAKYVEQSSQLLMLSQRLARDAREAVVGEQVAFASLRDARNNFDGILTALGNGDTSRGVTRSPSKIQPIIQRVNDKTWVPIRENIDQILNQQEKLNLMREHVRAVNDVSPVLLGIAEELGQADDRLKDPEFVTLVSRQGMLSQRIAKDVNIFAKGGSDAMSSAARFGTDIRFFEDSQRRLERKSRRGGRLSNFAKARVAKMSKEFKRMNTTVLDILNNAQEIGEAQHSSQYIFQQSDTLLAEAGQLVQAYLELEGERKKLNVLSYALGFFAIVFVFLLGAKLVADARRREEVSAEQNRHTQDAILKLLDEMGSLADGDLTIQPEVTEQITGAIADSVNFAVREMRALVERIKNAAHQVAAASEQSRQTATELTETTLRQAAQITETTNKMRDMATSMAEMSQSAERSAEVAQGSLETARRGSEAVQSTIHGMDEMREQIQETAKRIKRLGESSQQIGEIVELINDIAEQTNILSLNAAIQAAMAGEAGRGFAVVADEVQRLAERSAEATRQIADLVKTIQADTNEAVASMEKATNGVVETTRLADAAGQALGEIESVSEQLSSLIVDIAHRAQHHSEIATVMSGSMIEIQEATTMTSHGTRETADSIGKLSDLARELQASVAGFKLPT